jgi:hypothetical protein
MDPYLEQSGVWNQVHTTLIVDIRRFLTAALRPRYFIAIKERLYQALLPFYKQAEQIKERYLEIRTVETQDVITVIEILSPSNKIGREGREQYERKRLKVLGSLTNLVEIDLLRAGHPFPMKVAGENDYRIIISRSHRRPRADAYLFSIRQPVPTIPIPLRPDEAEPELPLNDILHQLYDQGGYDLVINYQNSPEPPLSETDETWARQFLA